MRNALAKLFSSIDWRNLGSFLQESALSGQRAFRPEREFIVDVSMLGKTKIEALWKRHWRAPS
jgi:hypothetical protein